MKLYIEYFKLHLKTKLQYKKSFIIELLCQLLIFFTYYFTILALFNKFSNVKGFTLYEVLLCFSIIQIGFSLSETFARGFDKFETLIKDSSYDLLLLRPRNVLLQIFCSKIDIIKIMRVIQGFIIEIIAIVNLNITWSFTKVLTLMAMNIASFILFTALFILMAGYCFKTVEGLEIKNLVTDGGKNMAQYPIGIFNKGFRFIFTFIIPYACVNYYPLLFVLGKTNNIICIISPVFVIPFLILCILIFNKLSKNYISVGG